MRRLWSIVSKGLRLLEHLLRMLLAIDYIFSEHLFDIVIGNTFNGQIVCENTKSMLEEFLKSLDYLNGLKTDDLPGHTILPFFSVLCLFLIQATLRSIQTFSSDGFEMCEWSPDLDASFDKGSFGILYQPMLLHLQYSKESFDDWEQLLGGRNMWRPGRVQFGQGLTVASSTPWAFIQHLLTLMYIAEGRRLEERAEGKVPSTFHELPYTGYYLPQDQSEEVHGS